jgi:CheY-like chemotaxis protein
MRGKISVASAIGQGSTFELTLPLPRIADEEAARAGRAADPQSAGPGEKGPPEAGLPSERLMRVLAAEDNTINQLVLKTIFGQIGVTPTIVDDGRAAVEAFETNAWDLILMDAQMPMMDGLTAARAIREREAATGRRRTPIIAVTANAMTHQRQTYLAAGMDGIVAKPIEVAELFRVINETFSTLSQEERGEASAFGGVA